jgi:hypothetical protein
VKTALPACFRQTKAYPPVVIIEVTEEEYAPASCSTMPPVEIAAAWRPADARQAASDFEVYDPLCRSPGIDECQRMHDLQIRPGPPPAAPGTAAAPSPAARPPGPPTHTRADPHLYD